MCLCNGGRWHFITMLLINPRIFYPRHTSETVQPSPYALSYLSASSERCRNRSQVPRPAGSSTGFPAEAGFRVKDKEGIMESGDENGTLNL